MRGAGLTLEYPPVTAYRIETSNQLTGDYEYTEVVYSKQEVLIYCCEPWRSKSVHVVWALTPGIPPRIIEVYNNGRKVSPILM